MIRPIHPFPARMAPELALTTLKTLDSGSVVLDPMVGSGTVVRHASELGHRAIGFDLDPLAVLLTRVWTTPVADQTVQVLSEAVLDEVRTLDADRVRLPWIDEDEETRKFVEYWFGDAQRADLRRIAYLLATRLEHDPQGRASTDVLRLALSRIIITKDQGASLGRDVSHSRPHKVAERSEYDVIPAFMRSLKYVRRLLSDSPPAGNVEISVGDARSLTPLATGSVDAVLTSPPYLNAIDYMRGHRLSLVWLGYGLRELRQIRAISIGAERGRDADEEAENVAEIEEAMGDTRELPAREVAMISRYAGDLYRTVAEIARVLKPNGRAILVVGNSCLRGTFIRNSDGVARAAQLVGLQLAEKLERELPTRHRYLPLPAALDAPLGKRMRTETILTFAHAT